MAPISPQSKISGGLGGIVGKPIFARFLISFGG